MGCQTTLSLVDLGFAKSARKAVNGDIAAWRKRRDADPRFFLSNLGIGPGGGLEFLMPDNCSKEKRSYYPFDEDELGLTPAMQRKSDGSDTIPRWCATHRAHGKISFHSLEPDGEAWAYELDGKGRFRQLQLLPASGWTRVKASKKPKYLRLAK
jgi:hypothetical protein